MSSSQSQARQPSEPLQVVYETLRTLIERCRKDAVTVGLMFPQIAYRPLQVYVLFGGDSGTDLEEGRGPSFQVVGVSSFEDSVEFATLGTIHSFLTSTAVA